MADTQNWPSWRYGPDGQSQIFQHEEQVPDGWEDHPSKVKNGAHPHMRPGYSEEQLPATTGTAAADPTNSGNEDVSRGAPETDEAGNGGGATKGGETGPTPAIMTDRLPSADEVTKPWIVEQLSGRKVPHNPGWKKEKLYQLLHDAIVPAKD
jgi:hypothetical protein